MVTVSDSRSRGDRADTTTQIIRETISDAGGFDVVAAVLVPDEREEIEAALVRLADVDGCALVLTTGGTGLAPRDITPEATRAVLDREVPGIPEAMRAASLQRTPFAMLSRMVAGTRGGTLIINLPGSPKAVRENLAVIVPALPHAIEKLLGDPADCVPLPAAGDGEAV